MQSLSDLTLERLVEDLNDALVRRRREDKLIREIEHELDVRKARQIHGIGGSSTNTADLPPAA
ncbi:MAG: hypothetical protein AAB641_00170 [Patescibacteria group bacterium]